MNSEWKYYVNLDIDSWYQIQQWCEVHIGEFDKDWYKLGIDPVGYIVNGSRTTTWYFKQEKHAVEFILRWS